MIYHQLRFVKMTTYTIKAGQMTDFLRFWRNNNKVQKELGYSGISGLFMLVSGGRVTTIVRSRAIIIVMLKEWVI